MDRYKITIDATITFQVEVDAENEEDAKNLINTNHLFPKNVINKRIHKISATLSDLGREPIPKGCDVFPLEEFTGEAIVGGFTEDDGYGYLAWDDAMSNIDCFECGDLALIAKYKFTKVAWFNK